jgi:DNA-binding IclR family transcriptional regulator
MPILRNIVAEINETAHLALYERTKHKLIYTDEVPCEQPIRFNVPIGVPQPLPPGASGKAIMAFLPYMEVRNIIHSDQESDINKTVKSLNRYKKDLEEVRIKGYAITKGERIPEAVGIACPIFDSKIRVIGSLVVTTPSYRFRPENEHYIAKLIRDGSERLSRLLGLPSNIPYPPYNKICCNELNMKKHGGSNKRKDLK